MQIRNVSVHFYIRLKYLKRTYLTNKIKCIWQNIDKVFKHKELQQQLMDTKLQRITEMMKEVEEKQQRERDFVSTHVPLLYAKAVFFVSASSSQMLS